MKFIPSSIPDVIRVLPTVNDDERGYFMESYQEREFFLAGITHFFVQDNLSGSRRGVLRGLHYQQPGAQGKLIWVVKGEIFDVAVDLRPHSVTFGQWVGFNISAISREQVWIPPGFAHGFYVMSDWADVYYKVTHTYAPQWEHTLLWNDPKIGIEWPIEPGETPIVSKKDAQGSLMEELALTQNMIDVG